MANQPEHWYTRSPSWRFSKVEFAVPWGWHEVDAAQAREIHTKLSDFERMTWSEIMGKGSHMVGVWQICKQAKDRLEELGYGDLRRLTSLRLSNKERVWGVMEEGVLAVIWWDPNHSVYPVEKKHT